jgi:transcriptional regulator with XRE-family HTH domain
MTQGMTSLTDAVRKALAAAPASVNALAIRAGVSQSLLARILSGDRTVTPSVAAKVAGTLEGLSAECARAARGIRQALRRRTE